MTSADTGTYLLVVVIGLVLTLIVGQVLRRAGVGFLRDVFEDQDVAESITRLLVVGFHLVALGFLALISTWDPIEFPGTVQLVVSKTGATLLILGIMHVATLYILNRMRNNRRMQTMAANLRNRRTGPRDQTGETRALGSS